MFDTPSNKLISEIATYLEQNDKLTLPKYVDIMKTSSGKENSPQQKNWYYTRTASILRKIAINTESDLDYSVDERKPKMHKAFTQEKNLTVTKLSSMYGCKKNRGCRPGKKVRSYRSLIVMILKDLEKLNYINNEKNLTLTNDGQSFIKSMCE